MTEAQRRALEHLTLHNPYVQSHQAPDGTVHVEIYAHPNDSSIVDYTRDDLDTPVAARGASVRVSIDVDGNIADRDPKPKRRRRK